MFSTVEGVQYCGGCLLLWGISISTVGDTVVSTVEVIPKELMVSLHGTEHLNSTELPPQY